MIKKNRRYGADLLMLDPNEKYDASMLPPSYDNLVKDLTKKSNYIRNEIILIKNKMRNDFGIDLAISGVLGGPSPDTIVGLTRLSLEVIAKEDELSPIVEEIEYLKTEDGMQDYEEYYNKAQWLVLNSNKENKNG